MKALLMLVLTAGVLCLAGVTEAQPGGGKKGGPGGPGGGGPGGGGGPAPTVDESVAKMMTFDKNGDGKLTKDEITDERLMRLFERADANKDGVVTKEELQTLFKQMASENSSSQGKGGPGGQGKGSQGKGGPGGPGGQGKGPGGPGGPGGQGKGPGSPS